MKYSLILAIFFSCVNIWAASEAPPQARACTRFINSKGGIGSYGELLIKQMKPLEKEVFANIGSRYCPNFENLKPNEKWQSVVAVVATLSNMVGGCNPKADYDKFTHKQNTLPPKIGGLFALPVSASDRKPLGCDNVENTADMQISCFVKYLDKRFLKGGQSPDKYWSEFRSPNNRADYKGHLVKLNNPSFKESFAWWNKCVPMNVILTPAPDETKIQGEKPEEP